MFWNVLLRICVFMIGVFVVMAGAGLTFVIPPLGAIIVLIGMYLTNAEL